MSYTIDIDLNPSSINKAIRALKKYERELKRDLKKVAQKTAEKARDDAQESYNDLLAVRCFQPIEVRVDERKNAFAVVASGPPAVDENETPHGNTVIMAEFGTGAYAGKGHPLSGDFGAYQASWSTNYGVYHQYAENLKKGKDYWIHRQGQARAHKHYGFSGVNAMYNAGQKLQEFARDAVNEVFR